MAVVVPFQGLRYNPEKIANLSQVVALPYDVIDASRQEEYYKKHPHNIIRLECGKEFPEDDDTNNRCTRAAETFQKWLAEKVLVAEDKPAIYRCRQVYRVDGREMVRTGFICNVKIEPYDKGVILPHQETLPKRTADRLALIQACNANFSPILGLYADFGRSVDQILADAPGELSQEFVDENGTAHQLTVITDSQIIGDIQKAMERQHIFIADGHHRYEAALAYRDLRRDGLGLTADGGDQPFDYVMMTLVNLYDPGVTILPVHRLVKNAAHFNLKKFVKKLREDFRVEEFTVNPDGSNIKEFLDLIYHRGGLDVGSGTYHLNAFGLYAGRGLGYAITLDSETALDRLMGRSDKISLAWQGLDAAVLHTTVLERLLGIGAEERAGETNLAYTCDAKEALKAVDSGAYQMAFLMNAAQIEEVTVIAIGGEKMPQKSTCFYPKSAAGLVVNKL